MPERQHRLAGKCPATGKTQYLTKKTAKTSLRVVQSHANVHVRNLYKCPHCGYWHLTSRTRG